jgi:hypothetical protein
MRLTDNRFYWLGADKIAKENLLEGHSPGSFVPAGLSGDVRGNTLVLSSRGVKMVTVWLSRDMIDWSKPVHVRLNEQAPFNWKPKILEPDIGVLLDDYQERGDRRMLFLQKLEFASGN